MCDSFTVYRSVFDSLMACDAENCKQVLQLIGEYVMDDKVPEVQGLPFAIFLMIRPLLDKSKKRAEAGRLGGSRRKCDSQESPQEIKEARKAYPTKLWRESVMERDGYVCQECGATEDLEAHHIKSFAEYPELRYDIDNGITLCHKCHNMLHFANKKETQTESNGSKPKQTEAREQQIQAKEERRKKESIIKEKEKEKKEKESPPYETIIDYLNQKAGTAYRSTGAETRKHIHARWSENYTLEDFKTVIDKKVAEWCGTDMAQYLRPVTLFGTKFESYLNAKPGKPKTENKNRFNNFHQREYDWDALERSLMK